MVPDKGPLAVGHAAHEYISDLPPEGGSEDGVETYLSDQEIGLQNEPSPPRDAARVKISPFLGDV